MNLKSILLVSALGIVGAANANIVISQVYGGGGAGSATTLAYDYVEIQNNGTAAFSLSGLSLQYGSATGNFGSSASNIAILPNLNLAAGQFFLVQGASASTGGGTVLQSDLSSGLNLSATNGKLVLFNGTTTAGTVAAGGTGVLDLVGYGSAGTYEGASAAPVLSTTLTDVRSFVGGKAVDTDQNGVDFTAVTTTTNSFHNTTGVAQAVPEPSAFAALGLGIVAIARRRRSAK